MTKNGIVHLAFHPCTDTLILAAADKSGHIGLWSVDADLARPSGSATKENEGQNHENEGQAEGQQQSVKGDKSGVLLLLLKQCCLVACFSMKGNLYCCHRCAAWGWEKRPLLLLTCSKCCDGHACCCFKLSLGTPVLVMQPCAVPLRLSTSLFHLAVCW